VTTHEISDQDIARAVEAGRQEAETEFRARSVRYLADRDTVEIVTTRDAGFLIPRSWIGALAGLTPAQLAQLEVWPDGSAIEVEALDIQVSVHGLLTQALPAMLPAGCLPAAAGKPHPASRSSRRKGMAVRAAVRATGQAQPPPSGAQGQRRRKRD